MKENDKIYELIYKNMKKKSKQFHWEKRLGIFRISIYILRNKWTFRLEISHGW
jgi:hypothetical protein